jgi:hypothetical protein
MGSRRRVLRCGSQRPARRERSFAPRAIHYLCDDKVKRGRPRRRLPPAPRSASRPSSCGTPPSVTSRSRPSRTFPSLPTTGHWRRRRRPRSPTRAPGRRDRGSRRHDVDRRSARRPRRLSRARGTVAGQRSVLRSAPWWNASSIAVNGKSSSSPAHLSRAPPRAAVVESVACAVRRDERQRGEAATRPRDREHAVRKKLLAEASGGLTQLAGRPGSRIATPACATAAVRAGTRRSCPPGCRSRARLHRP